MVYIRDCMLKRAETSPLSGNESLPSNDQIAAAVEPVVTALGGVEGINSRLRDISPSFALKEARRILASDHIEYVSENSKWLPSWERGDIFLDIPLMVVSRREHTRFKPGTRLGVLFNTKDYLQVRSDSAGALIGAYLLASDLKARIKRLQADNSRQEELENLQQELEKFTPLATLAPDARQMRRIVAQVVSSKPKLFTGEGKLIGRQVGFALPEKAAEQVGKPAGYWVEGRVTGHVLDGRFTDLGGVLTVELPLVEKAVEVRRDTVKLFSPLSPFPDSPQ